NNGVSATIGVQQLTGTCVGCQFVQFSCNTASVSPGFKISWSQLSCGPTSTPTATPLFSYTPTITNTPTATLTPNNCGPGSYYFEIEPNDTLATAHLLGSVSRAQVLGSINPIGDVDYFRFNANAG